MAAVGRRPFGGQGRHQRLFVKVRSSEAVVPETGASASVVRDPVPVDPLAVTSIHGNALTSHPSQFQSLNGTPGVAGCGASGLTRRSQLLVVGRPERAARTKANSSSNAALTPPLCVIPG